MATQSTPLFLRKYRMVCRPLLLHPIKPTWILPDGATPSLGIKTLGAIPIEAAAIEEFLRKYLRVWIGILLMG